MWCSSSPPKALHLHWRHALFSTLFLLLCTPSLGLSDDYLVFPPTTPATSAQWSLGSLSGITLSNGLLSRTFVTNASNTQVFGTFDYRSFVDDVGGSGISLLRAFTPEATLVLQGGLSFPIGGVDSKGRSGPANFSLMANNSQSPSDFVAEGPTDSLTSCLDACWANPRCNLVDWIPGSDCVLKACSTPASPPLQPLTNCFVYTTLQAATPSYAHGPFLNRTGMEGPGVLGAWGGGGGGGGGPSPLTLDSITLGTPQAGFAWSPGHRGSPPGVPWPPTGVALTATFLGSPGGPLANLRVNVTYELYSGVAALCKSLVLDAANASLPLPPSLTLDSLIVEELALNPPFAPLAPLAYGGQYEDSLTPPLFRASGKLGILVDLHYASFVNFTNEGPQYGPPGSSQPLLTVSELPGMGLPLGAPPPAHPLLPWRSPRVFELLFDDGPEAGAPVPLYPSSETYFGCTLGPCTPGTGAAAEGGWTERRGIALKRLLATIAPQTLESPLQSHITASDSASIRAECAAMGEVGWEQLIMGAGSGFNAESEDPDYMVRLALDADFCAERGVECGGYDLIGWTRDPGRGWAALTPGTGADSGDACFASGWEAFLGSHFLTFAATSGMGVLETDGPYAGYPCSNASHWHGAVSPAGTVALQSRAQGALYSALQSAGIYINAPDSYNAFGINRQGIGYNEGTFRVNDLDLEILIQRQVIYDATYYSIPSSAWSQLPCNAFHFQDPFDLARFELGVAGQLSLGIASFVYDIAKEGSPAAAAILAKWGGWYKRYRRVLATGDTVHVVRPNGQDVDVIVRAAPGAAPACMGVTGIVVLTNPSAQDITVPAMRIPLYYTGVTPGGQVNMSWGEEGPSAILDLDARGRARIGNFSVPARTVVWLAVRPL